MTLKMRGYFGDLGRRMHLPPSEETEILHELRDHVEDRAQELVAEGIPSDEALAQALKDLGASATIASQFYQVHSKGSWYHTALAVLPHILLSLMFALHLWTSPGWVALMFGVALTISVIGWKLGGRPRWTYPWLGYCLLVPMVSWGLAMSAVGYGAFAVMARGALPLSIPIYIASFVYFAVSLWVVIRIVSKVARPDWVMVSLAILPLPFLAYWFFYFYTRADPMGATGHSLREFDSSAAIVFLVIAVATAIFFRIGRRMVRIGLLVVTTPSMVILAWLSRQGGPDYVAAFVFLAVSLTVLLSPALFDLKDRHARHPTRPVDPKTAVTPN